MKDTGRNETQEGQVAALKTREIEMLMRHETLGESLRESERGASRQGDRDKGERGSGWVRGNRQPFSDERNPTNPLNDKHVSVSPIPGRRSCPACVCEGACDCRSRHGADEDIRLDTRHLVLNFGSRRGNVQRGCRLTKATGQQIAKGFLLLSPRPFSTASVGCKLGTSLDSCSLHCHSFFSLDVTAFPQAIQWE